MIRIARLNAGDVLTAVGVLHTVLGLVKHRKTLRDIVRDGVIGAVGGDRERELAHWFLVCGVSLILVGRLARWAQLQTGTLPASTGSMLLGIAASGTILMPRSGFWAVFVPALLALRARCRRKPAHEAWVLSWSCYCWRIRKRLEYGLVSDHRASKIHPKSRRAGIERRPAG